MPTVLPTADLHQPAVDAALAAAGQLLGMRAVYVGGLNDDEFVFERFWGEWPGIKEGQATPRADSFCDRLLAGAPPATANAPTDPAYAGTPVGIEFGIISYAGVPLATHNGARATFCGIDTASVATSDDRLAGLQALGHVVETFLQPSGAVVRRTPGGWRVAGTDDDELLSAIVLADLLVPAGGGDRALAPPPSPPDATDTERLQTTVRQLEHALASRVVVEQAIGVLAERQRLTPRAGFERLRKAARSRGRRVVDLAREVVASTDDPSVPLPPELGGRHN